MEKNNQPLILGAMVIGAILIIALALIFTRGGDDTTTETAVTDNTSSENREDTSTGENGEDGQSQPTPDPAPEPQPTPEPQPQPTPEPGPSNNLPSNWHSLTSQQKTDLNPFGCDHETQWVSAEDGTCIDKATHIGEDDTKLPLYKIISEGEIECNDTLDLDLFSADCAVSHYFRVAVFDVDTVDDVLNELTDECESKAEYCETYIYRWLPNDTVGETPDYAQQQPFAVFSGGYRHDAIFAWQEKEISHCPVTRCLPER